MPVPDRQSKPEITKTTQTVLNSSFDELYQILAIMMCGFDSTASTVNRVRVNASGEVILAESGGVSDDFEGAPVTVGTTAVELTFSGTPSSIFIQSDHDNTGKLWVGKSNVTSAGANAMARLGVGEAISLDLDDSSNAIYVISDTASQTVHKMALI